MGNKVINMHQGKNGGYSKEDNYADMLNNIITHFEKDLPVGFDVDDVLEISVNAWNMACLSKLLPSKEVEIIFKENSLPEPQKTLLKKMADYKNKKYSAYDMFISDYQYEEKGNKIEFQIETTDRETFFEELLEGEEEPGSFLDDIQKEGYINRYAIVIKPLKPFFDWLNSVDPENPVYEFDEPNIYLVNKDIEDVEKWLKKKYDRFFRMELEDWHTYKKEWPQKRSYKMFRQWFDVEISTLIYDMESEPVFKEL